MPLPFPYFDPEDELGEQLNEIVDAVRSHLIVDVVGGQLLEGDDGQTLRLGHSRRLGGGLARTGSSGLLARSTSGDDVIPASGSAYPFTYSGALGRFVFDGSSTITLYNTQGSSVPGDTVVQWKWIDGLRVIDVVDC
jgi:hypothetical protein